MKHVLHQHMMGIAKSMPDRIRQLTLRCTRKLGLGAAIQNICEICMLADGCELRNPGVVACPLFESKVARYHGAGW